MALTAAPSASIFWALAGFLSLLVIQRVAELALSARNTRALLARGAQEHGRAHYPLLVAVHTVFPLALAAEVVWLGARPWAWWPLWLALWISAQALRVAAIRSLGERWSTRILVIPDARLVRSGPYRWLHHPNYVAVVVELIAAPLLFGAWRTALAITVFNALALRVRIAAEERALRRDELAV